MNVTDALNAEFPHRLRVGRKSIRVRDLAEASRAYQEVRDASGLGASKFPEGRVVIDGNAYRVSYNGRVWDGSTLVVETRAA